MPGIEPTVSYLANVRIHMKVKVILWISYNVELLWNILTINSHYKRLELLISVKKKEPSTKATQWH